MDLLYEFLKNKGKISVDTVIQWMKDVNIIDGVRITEEAVRKLFSDVTDPQNVHLEKVKRILTKLASDQKKNVEEYFQNSSDTSQSFPRSSQTSEYSGSSYQSR